MAEILRPASARRESKTRATFVAAYREGLGLAAIDLIRNAAGVRIVATRDGDGQPAPSYTLEARWWCRRGTDAERIATAAMARLNRGAAKDDASDRSQSGLPLVLEQDSGTSLFAAAVIAAAKRCDVVLYADEEIATEAVTVIARVEAEIEKLRLAGEMKAINRAYRSYRLEAAARGERALPYGQWLNKYKQKLVRQLAAALR